ncbi:predicted protein [Nematostella vectensis]|uniref:DUF3456 domain-containing protein n=1 Tax=Nematostella vectensis TaxID=45351 RepID=A7SG92_NEMVE|nr:predicted protein [Nematostella vectensis]|eukprot:XP_001629357.1 predicted protein [Nematostella vectensis]
MMIRTIFGLLLLALASSLSKEAQTDKKEKPKNPYLTKFQQEAGARPTKCQVCRLMVSELLERLKITNYKETLNKGYGLDLGEDPRLQIHYHTSELRLADVLDDLCDRVKLYRARAGPAFPYIKGAKSHLREAMDDLAARSKVGLKFHVPDDVIEDYTYEVVRMKFQCVHMLELFEEVIEEWYFEHQDQDLMTWLCRERVLKIDEQGCLNASTAMPADYFDAFEDNHNATKKSEIPMREKQREDM